MYSRLFREHFCRGREWYCRVSREWDCLASWKRDCRVVRAPEWRKDFCKLDDVAEGQDVLAKDRDVLVKDLDVGAWFERPERQKAWFDDLAGGRDILVKARDVL